MKDELLQKIIDYKMGSDPKELEKIIDKLVERAEKRLKRATWHE
jgi:hypothetical protein